MKCTQNHLGLSFSVKGKKVMARNLSFDTKPKNVASSLVASSSSKSTPLNCSALSNTNHGSMPTPSAAFKFTTAARGEMGDKLGWGGNRNIEGDHLGNKGESHSSDRLVQSKVKKGVEKHLFVNGGECEKRLLTTLGSIVGGDAEPMVAVSNRWPHAEGGEKDSLAIHSSDLTNPHLMRDEPIEVTIREKNARDSNHFYNHNGE